MTVGLALYLIGRRGPDGGEDGGGGSRRPDDDPPPWWPQFERDFWDHVEGGERPPERPARRACPSVSEHRPRAGVRTRRRGRVRLSATEWAVLGVVAQGPQHGFAIAKRLANDGDVGRVWTVHRPRVYRALGILEDARLVGWGTAEPGASGPPRTPAEITAEGERLLDGWRPGAGGPRPRRALALPPEAGHPRRPGRRPRRARPRPARPSGPGGRGAARPGGGRPAGVRPHAAGLPPRERPLVGAAGSWRTSRARRDS